MKRALLFVLLTTASPVLALTAENASVCASWGALAETTMGVRQDNMPLSEILQIAQSSGDNQETIDMMVSLAMRAYAEPRYSTPEIQRETIADFRNEIETECFAEFVKG